MGATVKAAALHGVADQIVEVNTCAEPGILGIEQRRIDRRCGMNATVTDQERIARAILTYIAGPGDLMASAMVRCADGVRTLEAIRSGSLAGITGLDDTQERKRALGCLRERLDKVPPLDDIHRMLDDGRFWLVCPGDPEWPDGLNALEDATPVALWVTGAADVGVACRRSVAVTGSRAATAYGAYLAADFSASLATHRITVIAGGSFGVDAAAHRGALGADGITIAVAAGGLDLPYPAAHDALFSEIAAHGVIVSEVPPGVRVSRLRFLTRNRIIAALATGTVIVEAATRSGAATVARYARDLGRPVMAVPGPVTSELSAGCNQLIRSGCALLVSTADDVIDAIPATG
jgi:DNA processing protein